MKIGNQGKPKMSITLKGSLSKKIVKGSEKEKKM